MADRYGRCENARCDELLTAEDRATLPWIAPFGFCPSCRAAVAIGFRNGATLVAFVAGVIGFVFALLRYFA